MSDKYEISSLLVGGITVITVISSSLFINRKSFLILSQYSNLKTAFNIWSLIFLGGLLHGILAGLTFPQKEVRYSAALCAASFAVSALWPLTTQYDNRLLGAIFISTAATLSILSTAVLPPPRDVVDVFITDIPFGLLGGWLCIAASVATVLALGEDSIFNSRETFLGVGSILSIYVHRLQNPFHSSSGRVTFPRMPKRRVPLHCCIHMCNCCFRSCVFLGFSEHES